MLSVVFPSTLSYSTPLYDRKHTYITPRRSYNTTNIGSYSPSGSEASHNYSTSFSSESRQNRSRSMCRRKSRSICSTVSRPSEMGWKTNTTSIRTCVLQRQVWRLNLLTTCFSTFEEPNRTSGSL